MKLVEIPQPPGIYAGEMFRRARDFLAAFDRLIDDNKSEFLYPSYALLAHSLELFLKSFLLAHGATKREIKALGHKLDDVLDRCEAHGLPAIDHFRPFVLTINEMNSDYDFRYPSGYRLSLPTLSQCSAIMAELMTKLQPKIESVYLAAQIQFASDTAHLKGKAKIRWSD